MQDYTATIPATNYTVGRQGDHVIGIVDHHTAGSASASLGRFQALGAQVSAHYIVCLTGEVWLVVDPDNTAYHCGLWAPDGLNNEANTNTIGIEHETISATEDGFTDVQYAASAALHAELAKGYEFALTTPPVIPHHAVIATACPGTLDIARILREAQTPEEDMTPDQAAQLSNIQDAVNRVLSNTSRLLPGQPGDPNALGEAIARIEADLATIKAGIGDSGVTAVLARINEIYK